MDHFFSFKSLRIVSVIAMLNIWAVDAYARFAPKVESPFSLLVNISINIVEDKSGKTNGNYTSIETYRKSLNKKNEQYLQEYGSTQIIYNSGLESVKVIEAYTVLNGKRIDVDLKNDVEDKSLASSVSGWDDTRQIIISFPQVSLGEPGKSDIKLHYKIERVRKLSKLQYFAKDFSLDHPILYEKDSKVVINSPYPLYWQLNEPAHGHPTKVIEVKQRRQVGKKGMATNIPGKFYYEARLSRDYFSYPVQEPLAVYSPTQHPSIRFSSKKTTGEAFGGLAKEYMKRITVDSLPPFLKKIKDEAAKQTKFFDRVEVVVSSLLNTFRYHGNWSTYNGSYLPRTFSEVAAKLTADCKDYSAMTAAILREFGYKAYVAVIRRGRTRAEEKKPVLDIGLYNHAIVYIDNPHGLGHYWLDPTNAVVYSHKIDSDISSRPATVLGLGSDKATTLWTPDIKPEDLRWVSRSEIEFLDGGLAKIKSSEKYSGLFSHYFASHHFRSPREVIERKFLERFSGNRRVLDHKLKYNYNFDSRIVPEQDLKVESEIKLEKRPQRTTLGSGFLIPNLVSELTTEDLQHYVSDIGLHVKHVSKTWYTKGKMLISEGKSFDCVVESPWLDVKRSLQQVDDAFEVNVSVDYKVPFIKNSVIKGSKFKTFIKDLRECVREQTVIYEPVGKS